MDGLTEDDLELLEPHPDIYALFVHYNALYFGQRLGACSGVYCRQHDAVAQRELDGWDYAVHRPIVQSSQPCVCCSGMEQRSHDAVRRGV